MPYRSVALLVLALAVASTALFLRPRTRTVPPTPEGDVAVATPSPDTAPPVGAVAPPARADLQPTLDRSFEGALVVDDDARPAFLAGDLSGDQVVDLAVPVRPRDADALVRLNGSRRFRLQDAASGAQASPVAAGERLLAVVHGVAGASWREPADRPAYLVRHAVGAHMRTRPIAELPDGIRMRVTRAHEGDVIALVRDGKPGVVFWSGAAYVWADVALRSGAAGR